MLRIIALIFAFVTCFAVVQAEEVWQTLPSPGPMPAPQESGMAPVNGIEMYYAIYGQGEPLLLLHGGLGNTEYFANQIADFS